MDYCKMAILYSAQAKEALLKWYDANKRDLPFRKDNTPYHIWISEVMLQQTQVSAMVPYYLRFIEAFPDVFTLSCAKEVRVLKLWEGLGYYSRARNLLKAAAVVAAHHGGNLPGDYKSLTSLPGIGDYIACAILSIAFQKPYAVVDGNVKRVLARLVMDDTPVNSASSHAHYKKGADAFLNEADPSSHNQAMMELGAMVCKPGKPLCLNCPLKFCCKAFNAAAVSDYPVKVAKKKTPLIEYAGFAVYKNNQLLTLKRKSDGLLGGLYELPLLMGATDKTTVSDLALRVENEWGIVVDNITFHEKHRHAYTHFRTITSYFQCSYVSGGVRLSNHSESLWLNQDSIHQLPFHRAVLKYLHHITGVSNFDM